MIIIKKLEDLFNNEEIVRSFAATNFQQTYENFYSVFVSNKSAIIFIDNDMLTLLIKRDNNIYECPLNIEPILFKIEYTAENAVNFINKINKYLDKTIYFPLVYEDSNFYKILNKKLYIYKRLYTSICDYTNIDNVLDHVSINKKTYYSNKNVHKFENNFEIKYYTKIDATEMISIIEKGSWKYQFKQDMISKSEQLKYYSSLIKTGVASIAVSYFKENDEIASYRIDAICNNKVHVLKNSYREKYKKYSPGSYMLITDLYNRYKNFSYIDLYGGPGLAKQMIETNRINRYDMLFGNYDIEKELEIKRQSWDKKNYNNFLENNSIKNIFFKKENILAVTSCFGLGPVGKLSAIVEASKDDFNWFAAGEEFEIDIFNNKHIFIDKCFTMDEDILKKFLNKYNIKYALVVLKNKMARLLLKLGVKVIYVDSLPFMWSLDDANGGKVPYEVDCYCAQKTIELSKQSKEIFRKVKNLVWVNPIINSNIDRLNNSKRNYILINIGGLHSPSTDGFDYVDIVIKSLVEYYHNEKIIITTSSKSRDILKSKLGKYLNVTIKTLKQREFFECIHNSKLFITSPGLTTILESRNIVNRIVFLPPQNISQFYNVEYGKKIFEFYKEICWGVDNLTLKGLTKYLKRDEYGVIDVINNNIKSLNNDIGIELFKNNIRAILTNDFVHNSDFNKVNFNGALQVIENIKKVMEVRK